MTMADQWILLGPLRCHSAKVQSLAANAAGSQSLVWQCLRRGTLILAASSFDLTVAHCNSINSKPRLLRFPLTPAADESKNGGH